MHEHSRPNGTGAYSYLTIHNRKDDRARLVISNANCDEPTSFAMNLAAEWVLDQVYTSIDADPSSQDGSLLDWILKPGGSVVIEVKMNRK